MVADQHLFVSSSPVKLTLRREALKMLRQGHPWVYAQSLVTLPQTESGAFALVRDKEGTPLAKGFYDPHCAIVFRVCCHEERLSDALIEERIHAAIRLRAQLFKPETTGYRLLNGEGDGLPGIICDRYANYGVIQLDGLGPHNFWNIEAIARIIADEAKLEHILLKPRAGETYEARTLFGSEPPNAIEFLEHEMRFLCEPVHGQKTGFFLDQREHRRLVRLIAPERTVLNLFGYTGGFSIAAGLGGADSVTTVDIARPAIAAAEKNWLLNGLPATKHRGVVSDAMRFLDEARQSSEQYSLVIVDPPSFIHSKAGFDSGYRAYHALFSNALNLVSKQGLIAFASCSSHLSTESFRALVEESLSSAKRRGLILQLSGQPADHPFPAICQELQYLKFCLLKIEN